MSHEDTRRRWAGGTVSGPPWEQVAAATIRAAEATAVRWTGSPCPWGRGVIQLEQASGADHVFLYALTVSDDSLESEAAMAGEVTANGGVQMTVPDLTALHQMIGEIIARLPAVCERGEGSALIREGTRA